MEGHLKITCIFLIISVLATGRVAALSLTDSSELRKECFGNDELKAWKPLGTMSVENFIYMVEKIERTYRGSTVDLIQTLLTSFSCSRLENKVRGIQREQHAAYFEKIMKTYMQGEPVPLPLTQEEKCQLFVLLSPVAQTREIHESTVEQKKVYGYGVLSLNADPRRSIDMSKVLYGIFAGFKNNHQLELAADSKVYFLYASTISEVISTALTNRKPFTEENYVNEGWWTSNICTKEYQYEKNELIWPTTADILGAVDGFKLGSKIMSMENRDKVKLSQILRMYYSHDGFRDDTSDQKSISYCNGEHVVFPDIVEQTTSYMKAFLVDNEQSFQNSDAENIRQYVDEFKSLYQGLTQQKDEECDLASDKGDICETPSNVFVILDKRDSNITFQKAITGKLINAMNIGLGEDTITIYENADIESLHAVINASDSKADASCALEDFAPYALKAADDSKVLTDIKNIMTVYEENQKSLNGVPAKVVVYFNFGELKEDERVMEKARRELRRQHPHLKIIAIGSDKDYLEEYFTNMQPSRVISWLEPKLAHDLKDKICLAPAVLQHSECKTKSKFENTEYIGYIGDRRIHHWAMYPQYFLKTFNYKFQFKAQYGKIRVCFSRSAPIQDSGSEESCKETSGVGELIEFKGKNPCKGRTVHNCDPFYFSIFGREDDEKSTCHREIDDNPVGCKRTDLIEYTIKHEGIACSSGIKIISSPFLLLAFLVTFYVLSQQK